MKNKIIMLKKTTKMILLGTGFMSACLQSVVARDFAEIYTECGLGALIAPRNEVVAAVTNVTWDLGTTAISSNITSPQTCIGGYGRVASFIYQSYESLAQDLAIGKGDYLNALVTLSGCSKADKSVLVEAIREDFAALVAQPDYKEKTRYQKSEALYNIIYG